MDVMELENEMQNYSTTFWLCQFSPHPCIRCML